MTTEPVFVAFEGVDACGKGLQSARLADELDAALYSFPADHTPIGNLIRRHLRLEWVAIERERANPQVGVDPLVFQALHTVNRYELAGDITAELASGRSVVCDRYYASGIVYGSADGLDPEYLERIHAFLPKPDLYILLDLDVGTSLERRPEGRDRYEGDLRFLDEVARRYRAYWRVKKWPIVDGRRSVEEVAETVRGLVA